MEYKNEQYPQTLIERYKEVSIFVSKIANINFPKDNLLIPTNFELISTCKQFLDSFDDDAFDSDEYSSNLEECKSWEKKNDGDANYPSQLPIQNFKGSQIYYNLDRSYNNSDISAVLLFYSNIIFNKELKYKGGSDKNLTMLYLLKQLSLFQGSKI